MATPWAASTSAAAPGEPSRRTLAGERVAVHNLVGDLTVVPGRGSSVEAEIVFGGRDGAKLRVEQSMIRGVPTLRVVYPSDRIRVPGAMGHVRSTFHVRNDGTLDRSGRGRKIVLSSREGVEASADIRLHVPRGKQVAIQWGHGNAEVREIVGDLALEGAAMDVTASGLRGAFAVEIGSGTVRVEDSQGTLGVETGSGDIQLDSIRSDALSAETGSGAIHVRTLECSVLSLETGSGDIEARSLRASRASLETGSGNVELVLNGDARALSIEAGSGNVHVVVPESFGAEVRLETGSGAIDSGLPMEVRARSRNEVAGTIGDGRCRLDVETGSGNIEIVSASR